MYKSMSHAMARGRRFEMSDTRSAKDKCMMLRKAESRQKVGFSGWNSMSYKDGEVGRS